MHIYLYMYVYIDICSILKMSHPAKTQVIPCNIYMYICIFVYIYVYMHIYMHIYTYTYIYLYLFIYLYICIYIYIYSSIDRFQKKMRVPLIIYFSYFNLLNHTLTHHKLSSSRLFFQAHGARQGRAVRKAQHGADGRLYFPVLVAH